ncbi:unnamed protein product [Boreogadus saida]
MDNSLYVLENNVILRITENHQNYFNCTCFLRRRGLPPDAASTRPPLACRVADGTLFVADRNNIRIPPGCSSNLPVPSPSVTCRCLPVVAGGIAVRGGVCRGKKHGSCTSSKPEGLHVPDGEPGAPGEPIYTSPLRFCAGIPSALLPPGVQFQKCTHSRQFRSSCIAN